MSGRTGRATGGSPAPAHPAAAPHRGNTAPLPCSLDPGPTPAAARRAAAGEAAGKAQRAGKSS